MTTKPMYKIEIRRLERLLEEKRNAVTHWKTQLNEALAEIEWMKQRIAELEK